jgi:hypothetical protein
MNPSDLIEPPELAHCLNNACDPLVITLNSDGRGLLSAASIFWNSIATVNQAFDDALSDSKDAFLGK